jgi:Lrp/AsnC family transcriptional regulator for asnA, asnC and gidA
MAGSGSPKKTPTLKKTGLSGKTPDIKKPDALDIKIAKIVGRDARQSSEEIAKRLNVNSATIRRRLTNLIDKGFLHIVGVVDPVDFGLPIAAIFSLKVDNDKFESVLHLLLDHPAIRWAAMTTGRFDITAIGRFPSIPDLNEFITKQLGHVEGLRNTETSICLNIEKKPYNLINLADTAFYPAGKNNGRS